MPVRVEISNPKQEGYTYPNMQIITEEIPAKIFGKKEIADVLMGFENLVFNGTTVGKVQTQGSIELNQAKVENAYASGQIIATESSLGTVQSDGSVTLFHSTFHHAKANGSLTATDCHTAGFLEANGSLAITNCSKLSAKVNGSLNVLSCKELKSLSVNGSAHLFASVVDGVQVNGKVNLVDSKINTLQCSNSMTSIGSEVENLIVHSYTSNVMINGVRMHSNALGQVSTIYLTNTTIGNVEFVGHPGKIVLRGTSKITGNITNGSIIP